MAERSLLYVTQVAPYRDGPAGVHGVLDQSATAMAELAEASGLGFHRVSDVRALDPADLEAATVVALFTIGETPWSPVQQTLLLDAVRSGRTSVMAVHSATDSCYGWDEYGMLVGARFDGHPWTQRCTLDVVDVTHPAVSHLGATWSWHDEVYTFRDLRPDATVLLRARPDELTDGGGKRGPDGTGLRLSAVVVLHRGRRAGLLDVARSLPPRMGEPGLPPSSGRRNGLGDRRRHNGALRGRPALDRRGLAGPAGPPGLPPVHPASGLSELHHDSLPALEAQ